MRGSRRRRGSDESGTMLSRMNNFDSSLNSFAVQVERGDRVSRVGLVMCEHTKKILTHRIIFIRCVFFSAVLL